MNPSSMHTASGNAAAETANIPQAGSVPPPVPLRVSESPSDFDPLFRRLAPVLDELEAKRRELRRRCLKRGGWTAAAITAAVVGIVAASGTPAWMGVLPGLIVSGIVFSTLCNAPRQSLRTEYKKRVIPSFVEATVENGSYEPDAGISCGVFVGCGLFSHPDRYPSEDLISGRIGKTPFSFSEVHAEEKRTSTDSKGRTKTYWVDIFRGFLFVADFHKDFSGRTCVCRNSWLKWGQGERVRLEDPDFEKLFDVYSTDQVEARYILSLTMMERIKTLDRKFKGSGVAVAFRESRVIVAVRDGVNHFEAGLWSPVTDPDRLRRDFSAVSALVGIVEDLDLNLRIWSKE